MLRLALRLLTPAPLLLVACSQAPAPSSPHASPVGRKPPPIGVACSMPERPLASGVPAKVLVEVASVEGDLSTLAGGAKNAATFSEALNQALADLRFGVRVAHVMTTNEAESVIAWDSPLTHANAPCNDSQRWDLAITPHIQDQQGRSVRLDIAFAPAPPLGTPKESWSVPEHRQVKTTVVLGNQQLVVLGSPLPGSAKPSVVVLTPYVLRDDADMRRLFECMQTARHAAR
jgi:hypothetical protein